MPSKRPPRRRRVPTARITEKVYVPQPGTGQTTVWNSEAQITAAISGHFGGKSHLGAYWLLDQAFQFPGHDHIVCGPNFKTINNSAIPKLRSLFALHNLPWEFDQYHQVGFRSQNYEYWLPDGGIVYIRSADRPGSMQGAHAKSFWMDETVDTTFYVYETLIGRIAGMGGRGLITSTPYDRGWLYESVYKPWLEEGSPQGTPNTQFCVAQWKSIDNPAFSQARWEQLKRSLPEWRFRMLYEGQFERPMGLVYDCFQPYHYIEPITIPSDWPVYLGLDWGFHDPMACIWLAKSPDGTFIAFDEFYQTGWMRYESMENEARNRAARPGAPTKGEKRGAQSMRLEMIDEIVARCAERGDNIKGVYCDHDPDLVQYTRDKFDEVMDIDRVYPANKIKGSIMSGIDRNYVSVRQNKFYVFQTLVHFRDEAESYSWKVDKVTQEVVKDEPADTKNHLMDAWRYATGGSPDEKKNSFGVGSLSPISIFSRGRSRLYE